MATKPRKQNLKHLQDININKILTRLEDEWFDAQCALDHESPFQLLVATILSAQCTDERVNKVTPLLFKKFGTSKKMSKATVTEIEEIIKSTGFYKNKAKNLLACSQALESKYKGEIPQTLEELMQLAGVGRKTANVVLGNAFAIPSGIVVDTHVLRLSNRFGWVHSDSPEKTEDVLKKIVPQKNWISFSHWMIMHGRNFCKARKPLCKNCYLNDLCPSAN